MNRNYWKKYLYHLDLFVWASMFLSIYSLNRTWCFSYLLSCYKNWAGFCFCSFKYLLDIDFKILFFQLELSAFTFNTNRRPTLCFAARFILYLLYLLYLFFFFVVTYNLAAIGPYLHGMMMSYVNVYLHSIISKNSLCLRISIKTKLETCTFYANSMRTC